MIKIITTVGTSLLDNLELDFNDLTKKSYYKYKDRKSYEIERAIEKLKEKIKDFKSAEIDTIKQIIQKYPNETFEIVLIATDTLKSYIVAKSLKEYFEKENFDKKIENVVFDERNIIKDLNPNNGEKFSKDGLLNLFSFLESFTQEQIALKNVVLNISGGYKGMIPYLTIIGQMYGIPLFYLYENSEELIKIPQLPININWSIFIKNRELIEKLYQGIELNESFSIYKLKNGIEDFPDIVEEIEENNKYLVCLNSIGMLLFNEFKNFIIFEIVKKSKFYNESSGNKKEIENALLELYERLKERIENEKDEKFNTTEKLIDYLKKLNEQDDLTHGGNLEHNSFIFKSTKHSHIRLLYSPGIENDELIIKLIDYKRGNFNHQKYIDEFKNLMKNYKQSDLEEIEILPLRRPNV